MNIIEKIKAEIERMKEKYTNMMPSIQKCSVCDELLSFLSTLEKECEKPTIQEQPVNLDIRKELESIEFMGVNDARDTQTIARHFYDLGRQSKPRIVFSKEVFDQYDREQFINAYKPKVCEGLEEIVSTYLQERNHDVLLSPYNGLMEFGKLVCQWQKEQSKLSCEGLEEEYKNYVESDPVYNSIVNGKLGISLEPIARHFAQWGAEHRGSSEISNDLQSACDYANFDESHSLNAYIAFEEGFKKGAKWKRDQMMKELRSYCLDEMERFQGTDEVSRAAREVYYDIIGYLDNHGRR